MRIAIFSDNFYPELSGIADSIRTTAVELAKKGHLINFFAPKHPAKNYKMLGLNNEEIVLHENIRITRLTAINYPTGTNQGRLVFPTGLCARLVKKFNPDLIHVHVIAGVGIEGLIDAKLLKKPLVGTNHTPITEFLKYIPLKSKLVNKSICNFNTWFYNQCAFVSSPSNSIFKEMEELGFKAPHRRVSNPVNLTDFKPVESKKTLKKEFEFSDFTLLYTGRLAEEKKVDLIIKAVAEVKKEIPQINFVIAGSGSKEQELKDLAGKLGVKENVKFFGFIKGAGKFAELYNACDVFVITSTAETQSLVAMQAMACGLPVIGVRAWGLVDYINDKNGILIEPGNKEELVKKIIYLYKNPLIVKELGRGGREFVENFSPENIASEWEKIYKEVIGN